MPAAQRPRRPRTQTGSDRHRGARWARWTTRRRAAILWSALLVGIAAALIAARLPLHGDMSYLLPPQTHSVREIKVRGPAGDLRVRLYHPSAQRPLPLIVFFHGGGFVLCDLDSHDAFCRSLANATGFAVFEPNDATTWLKVKGVIESFLHGLWERGALAELGEDV